MAGKIGEVGIERRLRAVLPCILEAVDGELEPGASFAVELSGKDQGVRLGGSAAGGTKGGAAIGIPVVTLRAAEMHAAIVAHRRGGSMAQGRSR